MLINLNPIWNDPCETGASPGSGIFFMIGPPRSYSSSKQLNANGLNKWQKQGHGLSNFNK
jgi:hypothetical protein